MTFATIKPIFLKKEVSLKNIYGIVIRLFACLNHTICIHFKLIWKLSIYTYIHTEKKRETYFKGLDHAVTEAGESKIHRAVWQAGDPGKRQRCNLSPKVIGRQKSFLLRGDQSFVLSIPSGD